MNLKKFTAVGLSAAMILAGGMAAFAADAAPVPVQNQEETPAVGDGAAVAEIETGYLYYNSAKASIVELNIKTQEMETSSAEEGLESSWVLIKTEEGAGSQEIRLNLSDKTILMDTQTGLPVSVSDLKVGQEIFAYYDMAMTKSLPPQSLAHAILVNLDDQHVPAHLLNVEGAFVQDGTVKVLAEDGSIIVSIPSDTPVSALYTKNIVRNTDIHMGTRIFAWYDIVALSMPGQATATKVVVLPDEDREVTIVSEGDIAIGTGKVEGGVVMVPLKLTAQKLGFTVTWDGETETVHLENDDVQTSVKLGEDSYFVAANNGSIGMSAPFSLGAAAYEVNGVSWAPAELFHVLVSENAVRLIGNTLYL